MSEPHWRLPAYNYIASYFTGKHSTEDGSMECVPLMTLQVLQSKGAAVNVDPSSSIANGNLENYKKDQNER